MEGLREALSGFLSDRLYQIVISGPRKKEGAFKIKIRPVMVKGEVCFQETLSKGAQVFHKNYTREEAAEAVLSYMEEFKQLTGESVEERLHVLVGKRGNMMIKRQKKKGEQAGGLPDMSHNRAKKYLLEEGRAVPFLVDLGVQTQEGKIIHARYDKFRQINRYLEFVEDILPTLYKEEKVHIIDFGCGKSYLTFALYYYLHELKGMDVHITGLDLKGDVIERCRRLGKKYGYEDLDFYQGDIKDFQQAGRVDMVVSLHACDTATDFALKKAVDWGAEVIFAVPCCQHEVNGQIENELLSPVLKYGILKERIAALVTDGIRANLLEEAGYEAQILEFIDMEHTPKNLLIRAVKKGKANNGKSGEKTGRMAEALQVRTTLQKLMEERGAMGK
ncbi:hypothetical protein IMSAGC019_03162 [Lachnospiraceae bacterium]|nr:hypothetical protein IMSAGC019_03162 [Lachnospiraceae bacterium]